MYTEWTKAERTVLEKITLAALAVHYISGIEAQRYTIAEVRDNYWPNAKSNPGAYSDIASAENWTQTTLNIWELVRDAESHFSTLERILSGESAIENKAISAVNNEYQTQEENGHTPDAELAVQQAWNNAATYADEVSEESRGQLTCSVEQLRKALTAQYGIKATAEYERESR